MFGVITVAVTNSFSGFKRRAQVQSYFVTFSKYLVHAMSMCRTHRCNGHALAATCFIVFKWLQAAASGCFSIFNHVKSCSTYVSRSALCRRLEMFGEFLQLANARLRFLALTESFKDLSDWGMNCGWRGGTWGLAWHSARTMTSSSPWRLVRWAAPRVQLHRFLVGRSHRLMSKSRDAPLGHCEVHQECWFSRSDTPVIGWFPELSTEFGENFCISWHPISGRAQEANWEDEGDQALDVNDLLEQADNALLGTDYTSSDRSERITASMVQLKSVMLGKGESRCG